MIEEKIIKGPLHDQLDQGSVLDEQEQKCLFIGKNADYYLRKWGKSTNPEKTVFWNWAAFLFSTLAWI